MYHLIFVVINIFTTTFFGEHVSGIICIITILNNMRSTHFPQSMAKLQAGMDDALPGPCPAEQLECVGLKTQKPSCRRTSNLHRMLAAWTFYGALQGVDMHSLWANQPRQKQLTDLSTNNAVCL